MKLRQLKKIGAIKFSLLVITLGRALKQPHDPNIGLRLEHFDFVFFHYQVRELAFEARCLDNVVVNPVVVTAPRLAEKNAMVFETILIEPLFRDLAVFFGPGSKISDDVSFLVPFVEDAEGIRIRQYGNHPFWLLVGNVITNGSVDIYQEILDILG